MANVRWVGRHIEADPPARPKKVTGTRLAQILGENKWNTPFQAWCEITKTMQIPFTGSPATEAGKVIEPKQAQFMKNAYLMDNLITPTDQYGEDYFSKTFGDFFSHIRIFGGMWDYLLVDENGKPTTVLEMKTTKRAEDWVNDVPNYYALQASLYAWLLGVDQVMMVCSFLEESDYSHPEDYQPSTENTIVVPFKVSERYPHFDQIILQAQKWWEDHVETGISPDYDERKDAEYLSGLRKVSVSPDQQMTDIIREADELQRKLEEIAEQTKPLEDRLKVLKDAIKADAKERLVNGVTNADYEGWYHWTVSLSVKPEVKMDEKAMKADGIYDKYTTTKNKETYTIRVGKKENDNGKN